jgi:pullulanase/glycogen debranching enzyme
VPDSTGKIGLKDTRISRSPNRGNFTFREFPKRRRESHTQQRERSVKRLGNFPVLWAEWNAEYRDTIRRFWKGDGGSLGGLAFRLTGSSDNNAYCQDNEISWNDWKLDPQRRDLLEFTRLLMRLFHQHPVLRRRKFFQGRTIRGSEVKDLAWFRPDGKEMSDEDWNNPSVHCLGLRLAGDAIEDTDARGNRILDDTLLILLNAHYEPLSFVLPAHRRKVRWEVVFDTRDQKPTRRRRLIRGGQPYELEARSLVLLRLPQHDIRENGDNEFHFRAAGFEFVEDSLKTDSVVTSRPNSWAYFHCAIVSEACSLALGDSPRALA